MPFNAMGRDVSNKTAIVTNIFATIDINNNNNNNVVVYFLYMYYSFFIY